MSYVWDLEGKNKELPWMWEPIKSRAKKKEGEFWRLLMEKTGPVLREIKKILEDILKELKKKWQIQSVSIEIII